MHLRNAHLCVPDKNLPDDKFHRNADLNCDGMAFDTNKERHKVEQTLENIKNAVDQMDTVKTSLRRHQILKDAGSERHKRSEVTF